MLEKNPPLPPTKRFRLGGIVREGSVVTEPRSAITKFTITDLRYGMDRSVKALVPAHLPAECGWWPRGPRAGARAGLALARNDVDVSYVGALPDLFREGSGAVAEGYLQPTGVFAADEVRG